MEQNQKAKIMVVDDNVTNLNIARKALEEQYDILLITSGAKALSMLKLVTPEIILLDIEMPEMNGFDVIQKIKRLPPPICEIPVIFVTAKDDSDSEFEGLDLGAVDYISKPFSFSLLKKRVELHLKLARQQNELHHYSTNLEKMVEDKTRVITKLQYAIVHVLADMVERRDGSTGGHLIRTSNYLKVLLESVLEENIYKDILNNIDTELYTNASQLHDVGKISIPDSILLKEGKLTVEEFNIMKKHTTIGEEAIRYAINSVQDTKFLEIAAEFAGTHHEKWNGSGYPRGLSGDDIPISGRLMAIVDVYDALISERPYKAPIPHDDAVKIITKDSGTYFDPYLITVFQKVSNVFKNIATENV